jgi:hypothetical protein
MRDCAVGSLIHGETTANITDSGYMVIPVHRIATLGFSDPTPVLNASERPGVKRLVTEEGSF